MQNSPIVSEAFYLSKTKSWCSGVDPTSPMRLQYFKTLWGFDRAQFGDVLQEVKDLGYGVWPVTRDSAV